MHTLWLLMFLLISLQLNAESTNNVNIRIDEVRRYLEQSSKQALDDGTEWLENSANIGIGYNSVTGSPVCYSGECQMVGFRRPVFKLIFTKRATGHCTNKIIPQNVELTCLPSTQLTASTESISTLKELTESMKNGIDVSASLGIFDNSFSYRYSSETRSMVNTIIEQNSTVYFTRAVVSQIRLSAFEPRLEVSDDFRYVIDEMSKFNDSNELNRYIKEIIIDYFGLFYVRELLLGGIAQQKIVISEENRKHLQENQFTTTHNAELKAAAGGIFSVATGLGVTNENVKSKLDTFRSYSQQSSIITLGGATNLQSIEEWSKTISSNPTIIKFSVVPIVNLLTARYFPNDSSIAMKKEIIEKAQQKYIDDSLFCYNNCSQKGSCQPTGYLGFGQCRCDSGWSGIDCSVRVPTSTGLLGNVYSDHTCPKGYRYERKGLAWECSYNNNYNASSSSSSRYNCARNFIYLCTVTDTKVATGPVRTLCGIVFGNLVALCDNRNPLYNPCPLGYSKYLWSSRGDSPNILYSCQKENVTLSDRPGTLCGYYSSVDEGNPVACNGYLPSQGKCPPGYVYRQGTYSNANNNQNALTLCVQS